MCERASRIAGRELGSSTERSWFWAPEPRTAGCALDDVVYLDGVRRRPRWQSASMPGDRAQSRRRPCAMSSGHSRTAGACRHSPELNHAARLDGCEICRGASGHPRGPGARLVIARLSPGRGRQRARHGHGRGRRREDVPCRSGRARALRDSGLVEVEVVLVEDLLNSNAGALMRSDSMFVFASGWMGGYSPMATKSNPLRTCPTSLLTAGSEKRRSSTCGATSAKSSRPRGQDSQRGRRRRLGNYTPQDQGESRSPVGERLAPPVA